MRLYVDGKHSHETHRQVVQKPPRSKHLSGDKLNMQNEFLFLLNIYKRSSLDFHHAEVNVLAQSKKFGCWRVVSNFYNPPPLPL